MKQAKIQDYDGTRLFAWFVFTDNGRKRTWKPTREAAKKSAEAKGFKVLKVTPAPPPLISRGA